MSLSNFSLPKFLLPSRQREGGAGEDVEMGRQESSSGPPPARQDSSGPYSYYSYPDINPHRAHAEEQAQEAGKSRLLCCESETSEKLGHHVSIAAVALIAGATFVVVTIVLFTALIFQ